MARPILGDSKFRISLFLENFQKNNFFFRVWRILWITFKGHL